MRVSQARYARTRIRFSYSRTAMAALRNLRATFDPTIVAAIEARLETVASEHRATILLAVESGSRAWGFPSPDSDYDCRFSNVRRRDNYLALYAPRDVIEFPIEG